MKYILDHIEKVHILPTAILGDDNLWYPRVLVKYPPALGGGEHEYEGYPTSSIGYATAEAAKPAALALAKKISGVVTKTLEHGVVIDD